jgi:endonuclease G
MKKLINVFGIVPIVVFLAYLWLDYPDSDVSNIEKPVSGVNSDKCLISCPVGLLENNIIIDHDIYIISYNTQTKFSDWVAYKVESSYLKGPSRPRNWTVDPNIPAMKALKPKDFRGLNAPPLKFDRGHQAPLASFKGHKFWYKTNYLSNITPQKAALNQGSWKRLEHKVRKLSEIYQTVYVVTGVYYTEEFSVKLPNARTDHTVPAGYWKIIAVNVNNQILLSAFLMPQGTEKRDRYCKYIVEISDVVQKTGLEFFTQAIDNYQSLNRELGC